MIVEIPVIYPGYVTPTGKRSFDPAHLVALIPVEIRDGNAEDLQLAARATVDETFSYLFKFKPKGSPRTTVHDYFKGDGGLIAPFTLHQFGAQDRFAEPVEVTPGDLARSLPGAAHLQFLRGDPIDLHVWDAEPGWTAQQYYQEHSRNPFMPPAVARQVTKSSTPDTLVSETSPRLRRVQEAYEGARQDAIDFVRRAAADSLIVDGRLYVPSSGPLWQVSEFGRDATYSTAVSIVTSEHRLSEYSAVRWRGVYRGDDIDAAIVAASRPERGAAPGTRPPRVDLRGQIEVLDRDAFQAPVDGHRILGEIRNGPLDHQNNSHRILSMPSQAILTWVALRDAVGALPPGAPADEAVLDAAAATCAAGLPGCEALTGEIQAVRPFEEPSHMPGI